MNMHNYTTIKAFLAQLAKGIDAGIYTKATFVNALANAGWAELVRDLASVDATVASHQISAFQHVGILPADVGGRAYTYRELSDCLAKRLDLIRYAKENIQDFAAVRH